MSSLDLFLSLSSTLTGFSVPELWGTGMVEEYYKVVSSIIGDEMFGELLSAWQFTCDSGPGDDTHVHERVTAQIFEDYKFAPLARNLTALWYLGTWTQLPAEWRNVNGAWANDVNFVVSAKSYTEGLVWKAIHSNPRAAKQPGYGSWALPPETDTTT